MVQFYMAMGVKSTAWFESYMTNRSQIVIVNDGVDSSPTNSRGHSDFVGSRLGN